MTTIITAYEGETRLGVCSRTCYDSKNDRCTCICGGLNHGKGQSHAIRHGPALVKILRKEFPTPSHKITLRVTTTQLCLFPQDTDNSSDSKQPVT